jgi:hypothetical protein
LDGFPAWKFGDLSRKGTRQILGPDLSGLSICIAHNHLISCPSETTLRDILSRTNGSTGSEFQSQLQTAAEELNVTKPVGIGFSKNLGQVGNLYQRILGEQSAKSKNPTIVPELLRAFQLEVNDREIKKFQSKLPSTKVVSSLFGRSIDAAEDANDGWLLKGVIYRKD